MKSLWFLFPLLTGLATAQAAPENPFKNGASAVEAGRGAFRIYCSPCHGIRTEGGRGPNLTRGVYSVGERDADLFNVISNGASGAEMPSFSLGLGDENIWRVISYIRSVRSATSRKPLAIPHRVRSFSGAKAAVAPAIASARAAAAWDPTSRV